MDESTRRSAADPGVAGGSSGLRVLQSVGLVGAVVAARVLGWIYLGG